MNKLPFRSHSKPIAKSLVVKSAPDNEIAKTNCVAVNPQDFPDGAFIIINEQFVFTTKSTTKMIPGAVGMSGHQRFWGKWSDDQEIMVAPYDVFAEKGTQGAYLGTINVEISFWNKNRANSREYDPDEMMKIFVNKFDGMILQPTQILLFEFEGAYFQLIISSTQVIDLGQATTENVETSGNISSKGIVMQNTVINFFKSENGGVNLKQSSTRPNNNAVFRPDFKFEDMGIGGLDKEFTAIFRRAFASRIFPPGMIEKMGINHVKGLLLYGPPGTGKTLIARQIGKMLNARPPKIVNGPEILSKYVGSSEENIRNLFKEAEEEQKKKGDASSLHIIIFDELDSVFKQRGSRGDGTGVADNVVNQLLAKMDGVDQLNNILVIGMTNRKDLIDVALLRPGRFEVQVEIHLPDEEGRLQILKIKTKKMLESGLLAGDVDLQKLAELTKNFSGAEIEGLIKSAGSFALNQHISVGNGTQIHGDLNDTVVDMNCFINALQEVKPAFGVNEEDLHNCVKSGIIEYSPNIQHIIARVQRDIKQLQLSDNFNFSSLLLHGPAGSGKTALAAKMALESNFPFIKMVSANDMVGMSESAKVQHIDNVFRDAYKSPLNILIVDSVEALIDYVPIGPRFSSVVLRALMTRLQTNPPDGHRLIVMATTSNYDVLKRLEMLNCFNDEIFVNNVTKIGELKNVILNGNFFDNNGSIEQVIAALGEVFTDGKINVSIKKLLFIGDTCQFSKDPANEFVQLVVENSKP
ncbi:AAA family ATPase [Martiniozyma asiatica (nom. inval.)]|nr:AAA family ATPase [Martiniozyma asiatica]